VAATTAHKHRVLPIFESLDCLVVALADVSNLELIDSLRHDLHRDLEFRVADRQQLDELIQRFYGDDNK